MIRISITGPESTGKSLLAEQLAKHYQTQWVPEFARFYLESIDRPYTYDDILVIAQKQLENENRAATKCNLLFCDTDFCVTNIWCRVKFGKCHDWITSQLLQHQYDLYLLCDIDLPWQYDPLREHPEMRSELFGMYRDLIIEHGFNFRIVHGTGAVRLQCAIDFVDKYIQSSKRKN